MQHVVSQLETVRRLGRLMLVARRLCQWLAVMLAVALACGLLDYLLRLPGWLRLAMGLTIVALAGFWLATRLARAVGFRPDLSVLALRAERMYPTLAGALASGVDFTTHPEQYADPQRTADLAKRSVTQAESRLGKASLTKLLNPTPTLRNLSIALIVTLLLAAVVFAAPQASALAAKRWLMPLGATEWPKRNEVTSLVTESVQPADTPLRLTAAIDKGYDEGMRCWVHYAVADADGEFRAWKKVLMSEQAVARGPATSDSEPVGLYERLIDLTADLADATGGQGAPPAGVEVAFYFEAGDDWTEKQTIRMVPRPAVTKVQVDITPPDYAKGLVDAESFALDRQSGRTASASGLAGSQVSMVIDINKPVATAELAELFPGFASMWNAELDASRDGDASRFTLTFRLSETIESPIHVTDEHGLENISDRIYRIESRTDKPPTVAMLEPPADETVLATAIVPLKAMARDDVGVESLAIEAAMPNVTQPAAPGANDVNANNASVTRTLNETAGRAERMTVDHAFDLGPLALKPGDHVIVTAVAHDVYNLDGQRHDPVRFSPRILRIVDSATLMGQIRNDLAAVRQQAIRLEQRQQDIKQSDADQAFPRQGQLSQTLERQQEGLSRIKGRMDRNKLDDTQLRNLVDRTQQHLDDAADESDKATNKLDEARRATDAEKQQAQAAAKQHQENVSNALRELINTLDQGKDATAMRLQLSELDRAQRELADRTRAMLPKTAGRERDDLSDADRKELDDLAAQQDQLAKQAEDLIKQMKATAEAIERDAKTASEKATAQSLREAAATAQRQGLQEQMKQASQETQENKLSQAGQQQQQASNTMQQMMQQMQAGQEKKQQEMLRRLLVKLEDALQKLIDQQQAHLRRLEQVEQTLPLADALAALRRNTMAVAEEARGAADTAPVAKLIDSAAASQGEAVVFLRGNQPAPAKDAETAALQSLQEALKQVREKKQQQEQQQQQQERDALKGEYEKLAKLQDELRERTANIVGRGDLDRRQRAELLQLGHAEADLQAEANKLKEKVAQTLVFQHLHKQIHEAAGRAVSKLRQTQAERIVLIDQMLVARNLRLMADALEQAKQEGDPFQAPQAGAEQQGGQQGGAGQQPLVPPLAELRLLRGLQEAVYLQTRAIGEGKLDLTESQQRAAVEDLATQQTELNQVGKTLIQRMTQQGGNNIQRIGPDTLPPQPDDNEDDSNADEGDNDQ